MSNINRNSINSGQYINTLNKDNQIPLNPFNPAYPGAFPVTDFLIFKTFAITSLFLIRLTWDFVGVYLSWKAMLLHLKNIRKRSHVARFGKYGKAGWNGTWAECKSFNYWTPPRRLEIIKKRLCRMNAGSRQMIYIYFQNPIYPGTSLGQISRFYKVCYNSLSFGSIDMNFYKCILILNRYFVVF